VTALLNFIAADQGGALTYVAGFCGALSTCTVDSSFVVLLNRTAADGLDELPAASHIEYQVIDWPKRSQFHRLWFDQVTTKQIAREHNGQSIYSQVFGIGGFQGRQVLNVQNAVFFSDLYFERTVELHSPTKRAQVALMRRWARWSVRQADVVIAPSEALLAAVREQCGAGQADWRAVHHGFHREAFFSGRPLRGPQREMLAAAPAGVPRLLYASAFCQHKNVETLLEAFTEYRRAGHEGVLWLTFAESVLQTRIGAKAREALVRCPFRGDIVFMGHVPWEEMWNLYAAADVFVFPSFLESFGLPMVEAMASGLPIVASDTPVNREICQDAAVYVDTFSAAELAEKMALLVEDQQLAATLSKRAVSRSRDFTWDRHVREVIQLLGAA